MGLKRAIGNMIGTLVISVVTELSVEQGAEEMRVVIIRKLFVHDSALSRVAPVQFGWRPLLVVICLRLLCCTHTPCCCCCC